MCFDEGMLQAYLDGETTIAEKQQIDNHLATCSRCKLVLSNLEENNNFVNLHLTTYKKQLDRLEPAVDSSSIAGQRPKHNREKGVFVLFNRYKKLASAVAAVACLGILFSFAPVRSAAAQFLTIFRMQKVETMSVSVTDLNRIEQAFYNQSTNLDIDNFGKIENRQTGEYREVSRDEIDQVLDFKPKMPSYLPDSFRLRQDMSVRPANKVKFTLNVKNVNAVIKHLGGKYLLPGDLDGKSFTLSFYQSLKLYADYSQGETHKSLSLLQTPSPEVRVPEGIDVDAVRKAILELPVIPEETKRKLASLKNWHNTLYVPQPSRGTTEQIAINGSSGVIIKETEGSGHGRIILMWQSDGLFFILEGSNLESSELLKVAESLK